MSAQVKLYFDYKSPYAFLAVQPTFDLEEKFDVDVRWIPYLLRLKGNASAASTRSGRFVIPTWTRGVGRIAAAAFRSKGRSKNTTRPLR